MEFSIIREIKVGDILTSVSLLVSVFIFFVSFSKDRKIRKKDQADKIRNAASKVLAKLERWQEFSILFFQQCQSLYVDTSVYLQEHKSAEQSRDYLWGKLNELQLQTLFKIHEEEIEIAYVDLFAYDTSINILFKNTLSKLKQCNKISYDQLKEATQDAILLYDGPLVNYHPAALGNELRGISAKVEHDLRKQSETILKDIRSFLFIIINQTDNKLISKNKIKFSKRTLAEHL